MVICRQLSLVRMRPHLRHLAQFRGVATGNQFTYTDAVTDFKWKVPEKFNFVQDVVDKHAQRNPDKVALRFVNGEHQADGESVFTYASLSAKSREYASALATLGKLRRAVTVLPRVPEWWVINLAAMRTGTTLLPGTVMLSGRDICRRLEKSESDVLICDVDTAEKAEANDTLKGIQSLHHKILVPRANDDQTLLNDLINSKGWLSLTDLLSSNNNNLVDDRDTLGSEVMQIYFTSGTTGDPKMVPHTHISYGYCHWVTGKYWLDLTPDDLHWNISDTGWAKTAWSNLLAPLSQGAGVFVHGMERFDPKKILQVLDKYPITTMCAPPTLYRSLVQEDLSSFAMSSLRHCLSAGEPLNEETILSWEASTGILINEGYGQTETTLLAGSFKGMEVRPGSMGKTAPGYDIRIVNNIGQEVQKGQQGNIGVRCKPEYPPGLFKEYVDNSALTALSFAGDFYLTGDRGEMDKDGYIWFSSREDDVIISAGYRIGPFEVESVLLEHPAVAESAAVPSPDALRGQVVKAFIVPTDEYASVLEDPSLCDDLIIDIQNFVKRKSAPYKYPRKIEFVEALPKTVSGKIKRSVLKEMEKEGKSLK